MEKEKYVKIASEVVEGDLNYLSDPTNDTTAEQCEEAMNELLSLDEIVRAHKALDNTHEEEMRKIENEHEIEMQKIEVEKNKISSEHEIEMQKIEAERLKIESEIEIEKCKAKSENKKAIIGSVGGVLKFFGAAAIASMALFKDEDHVFSKQLLQIGDKLSRLL